MAKKSKDYKYIDKAKPKKGVELTPELIENIAKFYRAGLSDVSVSNMVGISPEQIREWILRGAIGAGSDLNRQLFDKCRLAVGVLELEFINEIRRHALGSPAEYAYNIGADGSKTIALNDDGMPIVIRSEVKPNPVWASWILERRFKMIWSGSKDQHHSITYTPDDPMKDATLQGSNDETIGIPIPMTKEEKLQMVEELRVKILTIEPKAE